MTWSVDPANFPEEDGEVDTADFGFTPEENSSTTEGGAGIGNEFGHSYDEELLEWTVWQWNANSVSGDFTEAEYNVYVIQTDDAGVEYYFSTLVDISYAGATTMVSAAIASATVLYALI